MNIESLLGIVVDIAQKNPRAYPDCAAILSCLLSKINSKKRKIELIKKIHRKFHLIPNTGHLEIWLQRISLQYDGEFKFDEDVCKKVIDKKVSLWNSDWLNSKLGGLINEYEIIDKQIINNLPDIIESHEVDIFHSKKGYY